MGSELPLKLPVIDFSSQGLNPGTKEWDSVRKQVRHALQEYGCFEALFNKVSSQTRNSVFEAIQELFDLPLKTKLQNVSKKPYHGYVGQYPEMPLYESIGVDDANQYEKVQSFTNTLWPHGNQPFCKSIHSYAEQVCTLDHMIRRMILESLGLEKYTEEHTDSTNCLVRVMKYKGPQTKDTKLGLSAHTDKNIFTILHQNKINGLEVETKNGKWIDVNPSPESFIALIGDSLYAWTNGRLHSPNHRVMMSGNETRYSIGLYSVPKEGYIIKAPEEVVDEEHPLLFKSFDHGGFLRFILTDEGRSSEFPLKAYCGV